MGVPIKFELSMIAWSNPKFGLCSEFSKHQGHIWTHLVLSAQIKHIWQLCLASGFIFALFTKYTGFWPPAIYYICGNLVWSMLLQLQNGFSEICHGVLVAVYLQTFSGQAVVITTNLYHQSLVAMWSLLLLSWMPIYTCEYDCHWHVSFIVILLLLESAVFSSCVWQSHSH